MTSSNRYTAEQLARAILDDLKPYSGKEVFENTNIGYDISVADLRLMLKDGIAEREKTAELEARILELEMKIKMGGQKFYGKGIDSVIAEANKLFADEIVVIKNLLRECETKMIAYVEGHIGADDIGKTINKITATIGEKP